MGFQIKGLDTFEKDLKKVMNEMPSEVAKFLNSLTFELMNYTKKDTPVSPGGGLLRRSWYFKKCVASGSLYQTLIGNNTHYAPYVEYGHRIVRGGNTVGFVEGRFMLQKNIDIIQGQMKRRLVDFLDELLKKGKL